MYMVKMFDVKELDISEETMWELVEQAGGSSDCCYAWIYVDPEECEGMPGLYDELINAGAKQGENVMIDCRW